MHYVVVELHPILLQGEHRLRQIEEQLPTCWQVERYLQDSSRRE